MKKFLSMLLALTLVLFAFTAFAETVNPDDIEDTMTAEDGKYELAFVTDVGQLKDKSFNQGTWNGVKAYAAANGLSYKYYQPANGDQATDDDRYDAMKAACEGGAKVVVCAGFLQEAALRKAAETYPDTKFVFVDGYPLDLEQRGPHRLQRGAERLPGRLCHREGRLHQAGLHGRRRRHQPRVLPLRLRLCAGRERCGQGTGHHRGAQVLLAVRRQLQRFSRAGGHGQGLV